MPVEDTIPAKRALLSRNRLALDIAFLVVALSFLIQGCQELVFRYSCFCDSLSDASAKTIYLSY